MQALRVRFASQLSDYSSCTVPITQHRGRLLACCPPDTRCLLSWVLVATPCQGHGLTLSLPHLPPDPLEALDCITYDPKIPLPRTPTSTFTPLSPFRLPKEPTSPTTPISEHPSPSHWPSPYSASLQGLQGTSRGFVPRVHAARGREGRGRGICWVTSLPRPSPALIPCCPQPRVTWGSQA